ncbi:Glycosyltransferase involved in cell wall bisynthesis [Hymenobacter actinosclerus]|uniref:Glycosyltransferase involved in cell wall bisynthesis n=2 Tax=Hymenobacter actinosclerus TaxID=82805 RepID=A0A1I0GWP9_9BACT|nr:Glycosyltransferase involved in cell wall bisynthesis [Hymenobacter actinosclerus]
MAEQGHTVYLFNQGEQLVDKGMVAQYLSPKVPVIAMDRYPLVNKLCWKINALLYRLGARFSFHEKCKTLLLLFAVIYYRIEVVHGHEVLVENSRLTTLCRWLSVPVVITDHGGYSMLIKMGNWSFVPFANLGKAVVAVSNNAAQLLRHSGATAFSEEMRVLGARIMAADFQSEHNTVQQGQNAVTAPLTVPVVTIYNGVRAASAAVLSQVPDRRELGIEPTDLVFGMIGRGTEQKGWHYAVDAFLRLLENNPDRAMKFLCMGEGPALDDIRTRLGGQQPAIIFVGNVDNPHQYMPLCDIGLMPSCFSEGLPLSIIEFYEHGIPVIASNLGGIPEIITPANEAPGGQLVAMQPQGTPQPESLLSCMQQYIDAPAALAAHGQGARRIRTKFDMDTCAKAYQQLFTEILA